MRDCLFHFGSAYEIQPYLDVAGAWSIYVKLENKLLQIHINCGSSILVLSGHVAIGPLKPRRSLKPRLISKAKLIILNGVSSFQKRDVDLLVAESD
jgi:hypothetical protein